MNRAIVAAVAGLWALWGAGCSTAPAGGVGPGEPATVAFADYPAAFDAARAVLGEYRFVLDRVDAARGVITTYPKPTAGLATPWDREQSSLAEEGQDLAHQHERVCRVVFEPEGAPERARIEVSVLRTHRPGWRVETDALRLSTHAVDPVARRAGIGAEFAEVVRTDPALERRLAARIGALLSRAGSDG